MLLVYETTDSLSEKWQKGRIKLLKINVLYARSCKMTLKIPRARSIDCCGERAALHVKKTPQFLNWGGLLCLGYAQFFGLRATLGSLLLMLRIHKCIVSVIEKRKRFFCDARLAIIDASHP